MKGLLRSFLFLHIVIVTFSGRAFSATANCNTDGTTDVTACLQDALNTTQKHGDSQLFLKNGTYLVSQQITVPNKMQMIGTGRGDKSLIGTIIAASASFPIHGTVIQMGGGGELNFGVQVKSLTIDGGNRADFGLQNLYSMEQSYGQDLLIENFLKAGLDVEGSAAQNSGPFRDLEIYPGSGPTITSDTRCIIVQNVISFRGIEGVTCNAGTTYLTRPAIALQIDGQGTYSSIHVEHFATAVQLGSNVNPADGLVFMNGQFGPDVDTGITIAVATPDQNLSLFGVSCYSCGQVLNDQVTGRATSWALGYYLMGNGAGNSKKVLTSDQGLANKLGNSVW